MLSAVIDWVESGRAPERVVATGKSAPGESRPLCPFPQHAQYGGSGDARDAANYTCQE
jgi:feruloyl esterase